MFEFVHNVPHEIVTINKEIFSLKDFLEVVPSYEIDSNVSLVFYIPSKKHYIIQNGVSCSKSLKWDAGDFYISKYNDLKIYREYKSQLKSKTKKNINMSDPYRHNRTLEYPSANELIIALWEHIVEGKSLDDSGITQLESLRKSIKNRFPKE